MAHFAKINENNIVEEVIVISNELEHRGAEFIVQELGKPGKWLQCSVNTISNKHILGGTPLRGNFPSTDSVYDPINDVFYPKKPYPSWVEDKETLTWAAPIPKPEGNYTWDENVLNWISLDN